MRHHSSVLNLFCVAFFLTEVPLLAAMPSTVGELAIGGENLPMWARADLVFQPSGEVDGAFLSSHLCETFRDMISSFTGGGGCVDQNDVWVIDPSVEWQALSDGVKNTINILTGTVVDSAPGVLGEYLGTLIEPKRLPLSQEEPLV
ncbi:MAG: hypothetical protein AAGD38_07010 [Acidobacteriota bacterium]